MLTYVLTYADVIKVVTQCADELPYMYVCSILYILCVCDTVRRRAAVYFIYVCMCVCMYVYIYMYIYICIYICMYVYVYICMYIYIYIHTYICVYVCMYKV
jgi:hypothetical protein